MTTTSFPSAIIPNSTEIGIIYNTKVFLSPLTGFSQTATREGARWQLVMNFTNLNESKRAVLKGYIAFLNGQQNRAAIKDHSYTGARGALGGTPLINGADQTGTSIITDGWPGSTAILKAGDEINWSNGTNLELKLVTSDVSSDSGGNATIQISPEIHTSPITNAAIGTVNPEGTFLLANQEFMWTNIPGQVAGVASPMSNFSLIFIEDIT